MHGHGDRCGVWQQRGVEGSEKVVGSLLEAVMAVPLAAQQIELAGLCVCGVGDHHGNYALAGLQK
jgi:hypothetical protein